MSPQTGLLASSSRDASIHIWNITTQRTERILKGYDGHAYKVLFSPCGSLLASVPMRTSGFDEIPGIGFLPHTTIIPELLLWDVASGQIKHTLRIPYWVDDVFFSSDVKRLVGSNHDSAWIWNVSDGELEYSFQGYPYPDLGQPGLQWLDMSKDGSILAARVEKIMIQVWEATTWTRKRLLRGHTAVVCSIKFTPSNKLLSLSHDSTIRVWDVETGYTEHIIRLNDEEPKAGMLLSPDGEQLAWFGYWGGVQVRETATWEVTYEFRKTYKLKYLTFSPTGRKLACVESFVGIEWYEPEAIIRDGTVSVWDLATGPAESSAKLHSTYISVLTFSPDGTMLASAARADKSVRIWSVATGQMEKVLGHSYDVEILVFSPNGDMLASTSLEAYTICVWDLTTDEIKLTLKGNSDLVKVSYEILHDLDFASVNVWVWNLTTGEVLRLKPGKKPVSSSVHNAPTVWDETTDQTEDTPLGYWGRESKILRPKLVFSPDGSKLACGPDLDEWMWDSSTGQVDMNQKDTSLVEGK